MQKQEVIEATLVIPRVEPKPIKDVVNKKQNLPATKKRDRKAAIPSSVESDDEPKFQPNVPQ